MTCYNCRIWFWETGKLLPKWYQESSSRCSFFLAENTRCVGQLRLDSFLVLGAQGAQEDQAEGGKPSTPCIFGQKKWVARGGFLLPFCELFLGFSKSNSTVMTDQSVSAGRPKRNKTLHIASKWLVNLFAMSVESNSWLKTLCMTTTGVSTHTEVESPCNDCD